MLIHSNKPSDMSIDGSSLPIYWYEIHTDDSSQSFYALIYKDKKFLKKLSTQSSMIAVRLITENECERLGIEDYIQILNKDKPIESYACMTEHVGFSSYLEE